MTPRIVHVDMTLTWRKVKVKVTVLLQFRKIAISQVSPLPLWHGAQNWWLIMIARDLAYSLSLPDVSNFHFRKLSHEFKLCRMSILHEFQNGYISGLLEANVTWLDMHVLRILMWPWLDPWSRSLSLTWSSVENHFSASTSSAILGWRSQLMGD